MQAAPQFDLLVIGGGINGVGIARDAAGRGLSVLLAEQDDLAGHTSSASTKLVHGGLRYLEYYAFRLVSESLEERETLLRIAPHIVWPMEFVMPHEKHLRPAWMIRLGLLLYDYLGHRAWRGGRSSLPRSRRVPLLSDRHGAGLKPEFTSGFAYYDCWVDDARLVVLNARSATALGAQILTRTRVTSATRHRDGWTVTLQDRAGHPHARPESRPERQVTARVIVNAAGPWVQDVIDRRILLESGLGIPSDSKVRLVKGSHIIVPRVHERRHAFILQNPDRRIVFMIPYEREFTLIGTTDIAVGPEALRDGGPVIEKGEIAYLCEAASRYSARTISPSDVVWSYSGVRPLYDDGSSNPSAVTRDYHFELDDDGAPILSVFGGKITTYRRLAEHALHKLEHWFPGTRAWTYSRALPGGELGAGGFNDLLARLHQRYPDLPPHYVARLARRHGSLAGDVLGDSAGIADLGMDYGGGLYHAELEYLIRHEWVREADDVLWRRTKCGLHMTPDERVALADQLRRLL
jgi:glycerol-3-phosphate dehydrogenase